MVQGRRWTPPPQLRVAKVPLCQSVMVPKFAREQCVASGLTASHFAGNEPATLQTAYTSNADCSFDQHDSTNACPVAPVPRDWSCTESFRRRSTRPLTRWLRLLRQQQEWRAPTLIAASIHPLNRIAIARARVTLIGALVSWHCGNSRDPQAQSQRAYSEPPYEESRIPRST